MINLGSFFSLPAKLLPALIHRSYCNEHPEETSNERLEFLGDAVLSLVISHRLYALFPHLPEGQLTARRSHLVQTATLAAKAKDLSLDQKLFLSRGEESSGGRVNPHLLANVFEAVLGAMYLDTGLASCQKFLSLVFPDSEITSVTQLKDPKSLLQEKTQARNLGTPIYTTLTATGPDHAKLFTVQVSLNNRQLATGSGYSKQKAENQAAINALDVLKSPHA